MKIKSKIVIFRLGDGQDGMPIYVGNYKNPDFITRTFPTFGDPYDAIIEQILAQNDLTPAADHYEIRLRQACVLT